MYSVEEKQININNEITGFRILKQKENKNRPIPKSKDILYTSNFNFENVSNSGDSGELLLATNKKDSNEKYIVKHAYYDCACNEYMYSKIGNKMGVKIAPVKLFIIDDKEDLFKCDFVCGVKYFENSENVTYNFLEKNKSNIVNWQDYFKMRTLEILFEEDDDIEVIKYNNEIYRIDTTDAFTISDFSIYPLAYQYDNNGIDIRKFANKYILSLANSRIEQRKLDWNIKFKNLLNGYGEKYINYYFETFEMFKKVKEEDIEKWCEILTFFYPNVVGEYFKLYFYNLKIDLQYFIDEIKTKESVGVKKK